MEQLSTAPVEFEVFAQGRKPDATSPGVELLRSLADEVEAFNHWSPGVPPPADAADKGLYIDPIYF